MKMIVIILFASMIFQATAFTQSAVSPDLLTRLRWEKDVEGRPLNARNYMDAEGSPEFLQGYCMANITVGLSKYDSIGVRLDLLDNLIIYHDSDGEKIVTMPVHRIEFVGCNELNKPVTFESGFPATGNQTTTSFYQVLVNGKNRLLKHYEVSFKDETPFNSAVSKRVYRKEEVYYAYLPGNTMIRLAKTKDAILKIMSDKRSEMEQYISASKIRFKNEEDLIKVFTYYNSL